MVRSAETTAGNFLRPVAVSVCRRKRRVGQEGWPRRIDRNAGTASDVDASVSGENMREYPRVGRDPKSCRKRLTPLLYD